ncbi:dTDP-glucose 4,6-dehydratase [Pilimelia anulata]|uniref:dTDP-glucose 4,6-dehydratase n=1 Tax=Pilimelia anulata TaxID=53371 RepID=A0A8J3FFD3_9ACTN|nr:NAD(P)-dependent oxidoreductase [Pilimelia anulata]GGK04221.1 dTDP-glucose 4,6-dehydratase [Pilimelia anulata]
MRVFVAGATGVLGRQLAPLLAAAGHEAVGLARSRARAADWEAVGGTLVTADALDRGALLAAVRAAAPDTVVHLLTAIPADADPKRLARVFGPTNRLRTEGTRNLLAAAEQAGVERVVVQSVAFAYDPAGSGPADEDVPFWPRPPAQFAPVLDALRELERLAAGAGALVLRLGHLYGPGTMFDPAGGFVARIRANRVPVVGRGASVLSFTHVRDAARAIVRGLAADHRGPLNIVDDDPVTMAEWLPYAAHLVGAAPPRRVPALLARLVAGGWGVAFMNELRGAANGRAADAIGWRPAYPSWRPVLAGELRGGTPAR